MSLSTSQIAFITSLVAREALLFGDFTLKSGRKSPYFINTGRFYMASDLKVLGNCYGECISKNFANATVIFGPAYKGIPLALAAADAASSTGKKDYAWCFDRKEAKTHGDGGNLVGKPLQAGDKVVIVDDVLTAGTALRQSIRLLRSFDVEILGAVISVDRLEKGTDKKTARQRLADDENLPIHAVLDVAVIADYLLKNDVLNQRYLDKSTFEIIQEHLTKIHE